MTSLIYPLLALLAGLGISSQAAINSRLSAGIGNQPLVAAMISFAVGTLCLLLVALFRADWQPVQQNLWQQPAWRWLGGILGAVFVFLSTFLAPKLGVANTIFLFILGQMAGSMLIDQFGLIEMPVRPVYWWKWLGMAAMLIGLILFVFGERFLGKS